MEDSSQEGGFGVQLQRHLEGPLKVKEQQHITVRQNLIGIPNFFTSRTGMKSKLEAKVGVVLKENKTGKHGTMYIAL